MNDWLTIEVVMAVLLVTSFTCVGLLAIWAATSPRHWFLRTLVVLGPLLLLLAIPACEPFLVFVLQAVVVVIGTYAGKIRRQKAGITASSSERESLVAANSAKLRFSLPTLFWLTAIAAIAVAIGTYIVKTLPPQNSAAWVTIVLDGLFGACSVLLGGWIAGSKRKLLVIPAALLISLLLALLFAWQDWFVGSTMLGYGWPPDVSNWQQLQQFDDQYTRSLWLRTIIISTAAILVTSLMVSIVVSLWLAATAAKQPAGKLIARSTCSVMLLLTAVVPTYFVCRLLTPAPIPRVVLPSPNGYDDFVAVGKEIKSRSPILNTVVEPKSTAELATEIAKFKPAFDRFRLGRSRSSLVPVWPNNKPLDLSLALPDIQALRAVARALMREAELARQQGRFNDAADIATENIRFAHESSRGGLLVSSLVGIAIEGIGQASLYRTIPKLEVGQGRDVIAALDQIERTREPLADVLTRERIWAENSTGWHGHLNVILEDLTQSSGGTYEMVTRDVIPQVQAINRMMMIEIALRQYKGTYRDWPQTLDQLVPRFIARVPLDPYDPAAGKLRYALTADGYLLYSVGYDGDDDEGRTPSKDELFDINWRSDGDLPVGEFFAEQDALSEQDKDGDNVQSGVESSGDE